MPTGQTYATPIVTKKSPYGPKGVSKMSESCLQVVPKLYKSCLQVVPKLLQSCYKVVPWLSPSYSKVVQKFSPWWLGIRGQRLNSGAAFISDDLVVLHFYMFSFFPETLWRDRRRLGRRHPDGVVPKLLQSCSKLVQKLSPSCSKVVTKFSQRRFGVTDATWVAAILTECDSAPLHLGRLGASDCVCV